MLHLYFFRHDLDLSVPYQRAVACRLLSIVCSNSTYHLEVCQYSDTPIQGAVVSEMNDFIITPHCFLWVITLTPGNEASLQLKQRYLQDRAAHFSRRERRLVRMLHRFTLAASDVSKAAELFNHFDADQSGEIDRHEFQALLQSIGISADQRVADQVSLCSVATAGPLLLALTHACIALDQCLLRLDVDGSGLIELEECMAFFKVMGQC